MTSTASHIELPPAGGREDLLPLIGFIAVAGPPPVIAGVVLVLGALMLAGPFLVIVTLAAGLVLAALAVAVVAAIVASPFVLVHRLRAHSWTIPFPQLRHRAPVMVHRSRIAS